MTPPLEITQLPLLPPRDPMGHKGTYGRVLIVAGSRGMSGAAILCGLGALRGGAGLVQVACPQELLPIVAGFNPCYLTASLPQDEAGRIHADALPRILQLAANCDVLALGPGLGQSDAITYLVRSLLEQVSVPIILDADGLNALTKLRGTEFKRDPTWEVILTPHPGEFSRLTGEPTANSDAERLRQAICFAGKPSVTLILKGHRTLVVNDRGFYRNTTGNPGMATGGTGDVLTGLIAALIGQRLEPFAAAQLGVYLHGRAGDLARDELGEVSLTALDVVEYLPQAIRRFQAH